MRWVFEIQQRTHLRSNRIDGRIPLEKLTGETQDISEYLDFGFYDRVWYHENSGLGERRTGRWLGVSHRTGSLISYWVLTQNGYVISRTTVQRLTNLENELLENQETFSEFDEQIKGIIREYDFPPEGNKPDQLIGLIYWKMTRISKKNSTESTKTWTSLRRMTHSPQT